MMLEYFSRVKSRLLGKSRVPERVKMQTWAIGIYTGDSPYSVGPSDGISNPVLTGASVSDVPGLYVADPFMIRTASTWYMFFEVLNSQSGRGEIGLATSEDGHQWHYQRIVLRESVSPVISLCFRVEQRILHGPRKLPGELCQNL